MHERIGMTGRGGVIIEGFSDLFGFQNSLSGPKSILRPFIDGDAKRQWEPVIDKTYRRLHASRLTRFWEFLIIKESAVFDALRAVTDRFPM